MDFCIKSWQQESGETCRKRLYSSPGDRLWRTFSPVARYESIQYLLAHAALLDWQMDVKLAYLHRVLKEEIYMEQLEGFVAKGEENKVCKLVWSLYGLKQAGQVWNRTFAHTIKRKLGFTTIHSDVGVYVLHCRQKGGILKRIWSSFYMLTIYYAWDRTFPRLKTLNVN